MEAPVPSLPNYQTTNGQLRFHFRGHPTSANQVSGDVCLHPTHTRSTAGHPAGPWRRWLSPGITGKPATKGFGSRWQHTVTGETEVSAWSRVPPAQPGSQTRLWRAGSATSLHMPNAQGSTQRLQVTGGSLLQGMSLQTASRLEKPVDSRQLPLPQHAGAAILQCL